MFHFLTGRFDRTRLELHVILHWSLRIACAMCFIGHGAWGVITKSGWLPFFGAFGIPEAIAWKLMPVIGTFDITLGLLVLVYPARLNLTWMMVWGVFTALLRPIAGMGWWEFLERGGNYGPPLAMILLAFATGQSGWFQKIRPLPVDPRHLSKVLWTLRISIALLLIGHGGFGAFQAKPMLVDHWSAIGVPASVELIRFIGWGEIVAGLAVLLLPSIPLLMAIFYWKILTELLYPIAGRLVDSWEFVERGGDYGAPLALISVYLLCRSLEPVEHGVSREAEVTAPGLRAR